MIKRRVLLITMGGTIAGKVATAKKEGELIRQSDEFAQILSGACMSIKGTSGIDVEINHSPLCDLDSSDMLPEHWIALAQLIKAEYDNFDAFLITHGTNTMGYTSAALAFSLANLDKPVIITGSQVPAGMPGSDAISNLENSLRVAVLKTRTGKRIKGVVAVFGSHIITGTKVKKSTEFDYDAFKSFRGASIGRIGRIIEINDSNLEKHLSYLQTNQYRAARKADELICISEFDMRIASLTEFPGMDVTIFQNLVEKGDIKGFILRAFGAGDASTRLIPSLEYLKKEKIPIVITTQSADGNSNFQVNEPGHRIAQRKLAIPAYDMSVESQTTKLAWLLAKMKKEELTYEQLCIEMLNDIKGEINVIWEVNI